MQHFIRLAILLLLAFFCSPNYLLWCKPLHINLVYISNMPNIESRKDSGGLSEFATLLVRQRRENKHLLFLHGGDSLGPSALSSFDRGAHMIDILNTLMPDAMAVAKREFSYKEDEFILRTYEAAFPMLNANIIDPMGNGGRFEGIESQLLYEYGQYKIGIFAIIDPEVVSAFRTERISIANSSETIQQISNKLRTMDADLVILMTGYNIPERESLLADGTIDILLQSDSRMDEVVPTEKGLYIRQGSDDRLAVTVELKLDRDINKNLIWSNSVKMVPLKDLPPEPELARQIDGYLAHLTQLMDKELGKTLTSLDTTRKAVRTGENAFGNLAADSLRAWHGADIALINGGGIRGNKIYPPGTILTRRDIQSELPFRNTSTVIQVKGSQLLIALENGLSRIEEEKGCFPHVSGIVVRYSPEAPPGKRVISVMAGNAPLHPDANYRVATLDFIAQGGDGYEIFKQCKILQDHRTSQLLWEILRTHIQEKSSVSPTIDGRLIQVSE
ncbi:putative 5'-Nucleotidase domain-containing protein [Desulfamplus magnetovallimortis]|uniref:Putative 5'-Nucleotidase domain-containing protein n=1 Tax=Desulfamplus magnetovallimortis TaxID=1246637 RepID=A0A1W1HH43_9BACT|nr:5'-nucleotidase C-terminal domain-containing protein [Desulfamplus magnetovallimortis]SLM31735.1 putative 5'-Nucleotidase domain-containing protein [Desulfamplus magnetovallimortis]